MEQPVFHAFILFILFILFSSTETVEFKKPFYFPLNVTSPLARPLPLPEIVEDWTEVLRVHVQAENILLVGVH